MDAPQLIRWIKPMLMGANPLERERIHQRMLKLNRNAEALSPVVGVIIIIVVVIIIVIRV